MSASSAAIRSLSRAIACAARPAVESGRVDLARRGVERPGHRDGDARRRTAPEFPASGLGERRANRQIPRAQVEIGAGRSVAALRHNYRAGRRARRRRSSPPALPRRQDSSAACRVRRRARARRWSRRCARRAPAPWRGRDPERPDRDAESPRRRSRPVPPRPIRRRARWRFAPCRRRRARRRSDRASRARSTAAASSEACPLSVATAPSRRKREAARGARARDVHREFVDVEPSPIHRRAAPSRLALATRRRRRARRSSARRRAGAERRGAAQSRRPTISRRVWPVAAAPSGRLSSAARLA